MAFEYWPSSLAPVPLLGEQLRSDSYVSDLSPVHFVTSTCTSEGSAAEVESDLELAIWCLHSSKLLAYIIFKTAPPPPFIWKTQKMGSDTLGCSPVSDLRLKLKSVLPSVPKKVNY